MTFQDTSLEAYEEVKPKINQEQQRVLDALSVSKRPVNNQELADYLMKKINTVTPRVKELRDLGKVRLAFKDVYPVTNRRVAYWEKVPDESQ